MLDHAVYPHIFDRIVHFAPTASLVLLRQTCRALRERVRPLLFEHVAFLPHSPSSVIHLLTASAPYLHLATLDYNPELQAEQDFEVVPAGVPPELRSTRTVDVCTDGGFWSRHGLSHLVMPALCTVRRIHNDHDGSVTKDRHRYFDQLPMAEVMVDRVDLTAGVVPGSLGRAPSSTVGTPYGAKLHILHLAFDEEHLPAGQTLSFYGEPREFILVLHLYARRGGDGARSVTNAERATLSTTRDSRVGTSTTSPAVTMLDAFCRELAFRPMQTTIVGIERIHGWTERAREERDDSVEMLGDDGQAIVVDLRDDGHDHDPIASTLKFEPYDAWMARHAGSPESMGEYYESVKMLRSRMAWDAKINPAGRWAGE